MRVLSAAVLFPNPFEIRGAVVSSSIQHRSELVRVRISVRAWIDSADPTLSDGARFCFGRNSSRDIAAV